MSDSRYIKTTGGALSASESAVVAAGFMTGFIFNNDPSVDVTLTFSDGSTYAIAPNEVFEFPKNEQGYQSITFSTIAGGQCKYSFTSTHRNSITIT